MTWKRCVSGVVVHFLADGLAGPLMRGRQLRRGFGTTDPGCRWHGRVHRSADRRREITVSTNNSLHVCMEWYTTCLYSFSPGAAQKIEVSETDFFDDVTTRNGHPRHVKHVLGHIYVFSSVLVVYGGEVSS